MQSRAKGASSTVNTEGMDDSIGGITENTPVRGTSSDIGSEISSAGIAGLLAVAVATARDVSNAIATVRIIGMDV